MFRFIGDMVIGWIIFTDSGKQMANKIVNKTFNTVKKNIVNNTQLNDLLSIKDLFIENEEINNDKQIDNRTKNR